MGGLLTGVVVLVGGAEVLPDELHAAVIDASATPTMSIERIRIMTSSSFPPGS